ncbi:MAG: hypothetical protein GX170_08695, partial [Campylobacteraceae bacterium]|nr:hypothetical protein [Campylobacteraceae bacterium]
MSRIISSYLNLDEKIMKNPSNLTAKGLARCEKLLDAAAKVFLHSGFEKASLNEIINISGGSLST